MKLSLLILGAIICLSFDYTYKHPEKKESNNKRGGCVAPSGSLTMEYNDVSALLGTNGVLFLDKKSQNGAYIVPKKLGVSAIYTSSLWIGGIDVNNQLKIAAQKFASTGNDFWTGPLSSNSNTGNYNPTLPIGDNAVRPYGEASISSEQCAAYDKFFTIRKAEVIQFIYWWECTNMSDKEGCKTVLTPSNDVLNRINNWPAHGDVSIGQDRYLAPFYDRDKDGEYNTSKGDYPWYDDILGKDDIQCGSDRRVSLYGDETNWWVFNDKGNTHTETGGDPIGIEIHAQAYTFAENNELNQMTFYNYEMINRGTQTLYQTYFSQYVDPDLGNYSDDYVGCDVTRGLGFCYNADDNDESFAGKLGYGTDPPAIGVDFFEGPYQDADGIDNPGPHFDIQGKLVKPTVFEAIANKGIVYAGLGIGYGDGIVDNERFGMKRFTYYTGSGSTSASVSDPTTAVQFYNYMNGRWRLGSTMMYGGSGFPGADKVTTIPANYMFPGDSDSLNWGTYGTDPGKNDWSEISEGNPKGDRRFVQSAGPFTLRPGAINNITVGIVYARSYKGDDLLASVRELKNVDSKAQTLFDNCFKTMDAPNAPKLSSIELNNEIILLLENPLISNNYKEKYIQVDPYISNLKNGNPTDKFYRFEGYQIFQLKDEFVTISDLDNTDKARVAAQCDIKNGIKNIINFEYNSEIGYSIPTRKVIAEDIGIKHSFRISKDLFSIGKNIENGKKYYYIAVAYAYNNFKTYIPDNPSNMDGQKNPYLRSKKTFDGKNITPIEITPHYIPTIDLLPKVDYGYSPKITRLDGRGNGNRSVELVKPSFDEIVYKGKLDNPTYDYGKGPLNIKIVDPLNLAEGYFECKFRNYKVSSNQTNESINNDAVDTASWVIYRYNSKDDTQKIDSVISENTIAVNNEQIIPKWGVSVQIVQSDAASIDANMNTKYEYRRYAEPLSASITFSDSSKKWLRFVSDNNQFHPNNWIRSGINVALAKDNDPTLGYNNPFLFPDAYYGSDNSGNEVWLDKDQKFSKLLSGGIAPHCLVGYQSDYMPLAYPSTLSSYLVDIRERVSLIRTPSIDLVITSDTSKWTKCAVIELGRNPSLTEGGAEAGKLRKGISVDKLGKSIAGSTGMGWFPGYAIDVETGVRLHMAFGENSFLVKDNGRDMIWNPSDILYDNSGQPHLGGQHPIYIFGNKVHSFTDNNRNCPYYDGVNNWVYDNFKTGDATSLVNAYTSLVWVVNPLLASSHTLLSSNVVIKARLSKQYNDYTATGKNNGKPMYSWEIENDILATLSIEKNKDFMIDDKISFYPNPTKDILYLKFDKAAINNLHYKIYHISGQQVKYGLLNENVKSISFEDLPPNLYIIEIYNEYKIVSTHKIIKH